MRSSRSSPSTPIEIVYPENSLYATDIEEPEFIEFEVILGSGAGAHVVSAAMIPGYVVEESELSRAGAGFVAADGGRMKNRGEAKLKMITTDSRGGDHQVHSTFQVADVTRALWSVALICDSGLDVRFGRESAVVVDSKGIEICKFQRRNGLYVARTRLLTPLYKGFQRPGQ